MRFSERTRWELHEDAWAELLHAKRQSEAALLDLTISNPTQCGLGPRANDVLGALSDPGALRYTPDPLGMLPARKAVCHYYRDHGATVHPHQICLTTSTSEAYSFLFRLLCDPGDEVLIAQPSYPLFDLLAQLDDVRLRPYPLFYDPGGGSNGRWTLDIPALQAAITEHTRAVVVVHPNNPTGNYSSAEERVALVRLCAERRLVLLVDEVFLDFATGELPEPIQSYTAGESPCLCFVLSGLSKVCALPQMKLSWIVTIGPEPLVTEAMRRLEIVADTFLSVNAPVQHALEGWLAARNGTQTRIRERCKANLAVLDQRLEATLATRLAVEGGWTAVLRVPRYVGGEAFAVAALQRGVLVQPGALYGMREGYCVVSLLCDPEAWGEGLARLPLEG